MKRIGLLFLAVVLAIATVSVSATDLTPRRLKYRIEFFASSTFPIFDFFISTIPLSGKIDEVLAPSDDGTWRLDRSGLIYGFKSKEISQFRLKKNGVMEPIWYLRNQTGLVKDNHAEVKFPKKNTEIFDPITLSLRIGLDLQKNPRQKRFSYLLADAPGKESLQTYIVTGREDIETPVGIMNTLVIESIEPPDEAKHYVFWLAPKYDYLIVRARTLLEGNKRVEINVKGGSINKQPISGQKSGG